VLRSYWMMILGILIITIPVYSENNYKTHIISHGETLWSIVRQYKISYSLLLSLNPGLSPKNYNAGSKIKLPASFNPLTTRQIYYVKSGDTIWSISKKFSLSVDQLRKLNQFQSNKILSVGEKILISGNYKTSYDNEIQKVFSSNNKLSWPIKGFMIERYGVNNILFNGGIKIQSASNKIQSALSGRVIFVGEVRGFGLTVMIEHSKGFATIYSSKRSISAVKMGDFVNKGSVICYRDKSIENMILYFQVWKNNRLENPINYLKS